MCGIYADFSQGKVLIVAKIPRVTTADIFPSIRALGNWQKGLLLSQADEKLGTPQTKPMQLFSSSLYVS